MDGAHHLNLIEALQSEARWESSGCFTLDLERSTHWLSSGLFREPDFFWLKWIQFGVAAQAEKLEWSCTNSQVSLSMWGPNFRPQQLPQPRELLQKPLLQSDHFALALHALRAQKQRCAVICSEPNSGWLLQMEGEQIRLESAPTTPQPQLQVALLNHRRSSELPAFLQERARYCCLPLSWNGRRWDGKAQKPGQLKANNYHWLVDRLYLHDRLPAPLRLPPFVDMPAAVYDTGAGYQDFYSRSTTLLYQWRSFQLRGSLYPGMALPGCRVQQQRALLPLLKVSPGSQLLYRGGFRAGNAFRGLSLYQALCVHEYPYPLLDRQCPVGRGRWRIPSLPSKRAPNWLYLYQDGILLEPVAFEASFSGSQLVWADDQIETDLSGLKPVLQSVRLQKLLQWLDEETVKIRLDVRKTLYWSEKYGVPSDWPQQVAGCHGIELKLLPLE